MKEGKTERKPRIEDRLAELERRIEQADRQSRCIHTWEPERGDQSKWVCAYCGCRPLRQS